MVNLILKSDQWSRQTRSGLTPGSPICCNLVGRRALQITMCPVDVTGLRLTPEVPSDRRFDLFCVSGHHYQAEIIIRKTIKLSSWSGVTARLQTRWGWGDDALRCDANVDVNSCWPDRPGLGARDVDDTLTNDRSRGIPSYPVSPSLTDQGKHTRPFASFFNQGGSYRLLGGLPSDQRRSPYSPSASRRLPVGNYTTRVVHKERTPCQGDDARVRGR